MIDFLLIAICVLVVLQPTEERMIVATIYAGLCVIHNIASVEFVGFTYYMTAGMFDLVILALLCSYGAAGRLTRNLISVCMVSIVLNFYGWLIWFLYQPPMTYNIASMALYLIAILILSEKECSHEYGLNQRHSSLLSFNYKGTAIYRLLQKEG